MEKTIPQGIIICGILCLTGFGMFTVALGYNGIVITTVVALIAAAMGLATPLEKIIKVK